MFAKAIRNVSSSVSSTVSTSVSRAIDRSNDWVTLATRGGVKAANAGQGFYESSFDLRTGLEVAEASLLALPDELAREFKRQRLG